MSLAVVTGGSGGIGTAVARRLLASGHEVLLTGRDAGALEEAAASLGGEVAVAAFDVTDEDAVEDALEGRDVDVLVANAGTAWSAPVERTNLADWDRLLAVNATGVFLCVRAVLPGMRERDHGRIVTVASTAALVGARYTAAYTASKHAALGLTRAVAAEVAGTGVTANAVCPTFVDTPMTERTVANIAARTMRGEAEARASLERMSPLGRLVDPDEVAAAVAYLASDAAAAVNGQTIVLDGGGIQR